MAKIEISCGSQTEELLNDLLREFDDAALDHIEVERKFDESRGLASEPTTVLVTLTLTPVLGAIALRSIERWLESRRQRAANDLLLRAYEMSDAAGSAALELLKKHADVSIRHGWAVVSLRSTDKIKHSR